MFCNLILNLFCKQADISCFAFANKTPESIFHMARDKWGTQ